MKTVVICGDSFNCDDSDYPGVHWSQKIKNLLPDVKLINLSIPGASNLLIRIQIDRAIALAPYAIIVHFTSSFRATIKYREKQRHNNIIDRFHPITSNNNSTDLVSMPYRILDLLDIGLSDNQKKILKEYFTNFIDLDLARLESYYLITNAIDAVMQNNINFRFSLGGFDHKSFEPEKLFDFSKYKKYETPINLWDYHTEKRKLRPWFHIEDEKIQSELAEYYTCLIKS
jgi:hypothetical protein